MNVFLCSNIMSSLCILYFTINMQHIRQTGPHKYTFTMILNHLYFIIIFIQRYHYLIFVFIKSSSHTLISVIKIHFFYFQYETKKFYDCNYTLILPGINNNITINFKGKNIQNTHNTQKNGWQNIGFIYLRFALLRLMFCY